jgi:hypothetical protein
MFRFGQRRTSLKTLLVTALVASTLSGLASPSKASPVYPIDPTLYTLTPTGNAWLDVPVSQRTYMFNRGMVEGTDWSSGDDVMRYLPSGQRCSYSSSDNLGFNGPAIYWTRVDGSTSDLVCTTDVTVDTQIERANIPIPFGFEINFGGESYDGGYLIPAGGLIFGPEEFTYSQSAAEAASRIKTSGISPLGADMKPYTIANDPATSSYIWTAQTMINGKQAFVSSWENVRAWYNALQRFSFQTVLINEGNGNFTTWFNYEKVESTNGASGYRAPALFANLVDGKVEQNEFKIYSTKGFESHFDICISAIDADGQLYSASTSPFVTQSWSEAVGSFMVKNSSTVKLFSDTSCSTPVLDDQFEGSKYLHIAMRNDEVLLGYESVLAGWFVWNDTDTSDLNLEVTEFFPNSKFVDLVDGGSKALISNSLNSKIPGRYIVGMVNGSTVGDSALDTSLGRPTTSLYPAPAAVTKPAAVTNGKKTITFTYGKGTLSKKQKLRIKKAVTASGKNARYEITGGVGDILNVTTKREKALAMKRANVVKAYLVKLGVKKSNITTKIRIYKPGVAPKTKILGKILTS